MKYFVMLASDSDEGAWEDLTPEQQEDEMARHEAFGEACNQAEGVELVGGDALGDGSMAKTLRTRNGELTVSDGPFVEAAEKIGGYYLVNAPDMDTVVELCRVLPSYDIDIRPVLEVG